MSSRSIVVVFVGCVLLTSSSARADDELTERARSLWGEAGELERRGLWSAAQERLRAAIKIRETPHLRFALGWALENDDRLLEAKCEYEAALRSSAKTGAEDVLRLARSRIADVEKKTPVIEVRAAARVRVLVDGRPPIEHETVMSLQVNPGSHVVRLERADRLAEEQIVYVQRSERRVLAPFESEVEARRTIVRDRQKSAGKTASWLLVAGGAALFATGGGLSLSADSGQATQQTIGLTLGSAGLFASALGVWMLLRREPVLRF